MYVCVQCMFVCNMCGKDLTYSDIFRYMDQSYCSSFCTNFTISKTYTPENETFQSTLIEYLAIVLSCFGINSNEKKKLKNV